ncbi:MAG: hypothetical protein A3H91_10740 [Gammaproteobacteria bacterium RIFCSPLOWO2_02_FULL_61_13]|nr:MAG: hypothetical protein A3H91_10740 [Gammaproteobacteria bacterium RIFCSPLOWO2_02_FULL_61_13]
MRNKALIYWVISAVLVCLAHTVAAEEKERTWKGIEQMMTSGEFKAAGLEKLSPEELSKLNQWMMQFIAHDSQQVVKTDVAIQKLQNAPVHRRIAGEFRGWAGDTTFNLDNGEVWRQRLPGRYYAKMVNPEIEITKNLLGFYELKIVESGKKIGVTRVK